MCCRVNSCYHQPSSHCSRRDSSQSELEPFTLCVTVESAWNNTHSFVRPSWGLTPVCETRYSAALQIPRLSWAGSLIGPSCGAYLKKSCAFVDNLTGCLFTLPCFNFFSQLNVESHLGSPLSTSIKFTTKNKYRTQDKYNLCFISSIYVIRNSLIQGMC